MPRAFPRILLAVAMALVLAAPLVAQTNTGNVYGNVIDEQGTPIPGGAATLTGTAAPRTTTVDAQGFFRFLKIAPGKYKLIVTMPGFTTLTRENVDVTVGQNTQVDVRLKLSSVQENVTVTSETPLIDTRKVETGQTFGKEQLTEIPTARDVWSLVQQVPGVQLETVNVAGNSSAVVGGPSMTNKGSGNIVYQVDGATITDNSYGASAFNRDNGGTNSFFDFSTFENVEVVTGGSVLDQQSSGVTINMVTKRGSNQLKGSARYYYASANWQSNNTPQEAVDEGFQTNSTRFIREYGGELGGPILKDRLWLWAAGSYQTISLNNTQTAYAGGFAFPETANLEPWSAKLNMQVSNANSAALYYQRSDRTQSNQGAAPNRDPTSYRNLFIPTNFYKAEDSNVFSSDLFGSIFANYQNPDYKHLPIAGLDSDAQYYSVDNFETWQYHNSYYYYISKNPQKQANLQVSKFFNTGKINHELKVSFNYRQQINDSASGLPGSQNLGSQYTSSASAIISRGVRTIYTTQYWSGTLGDTLTSGNLTVQAGLRFDKQQAKNLPSNALANVEFADPCTNCGADGGSFPGLPAIQYHGAQTWQFDFTNWQPRVSATYALGEKKNTLLRASYARYADQMGFLGYYGNGVPISNGYYYGWTDLNGDHNVQKNEVNFNDPRGFYYGIDPTVLPNIPNVIEPGFKTAATNEFTGGADYQLTDDFAVSGTFSYRSTTSLLENIPTGSGVSTYDLVGRAAGQATAANGFTLNFDEPVYGLNLAEAPAGVTLLNRPGATQRYYGVDLAIVKRLSNNWMVRANVGWNSFKQYLTAQSIENPNNLWDLGAQNANGGLVLGSTGNAQDSFVGVNASWQFNVSGLYQGPWGLNFGANFFGRQGYPLPYYVRSYTYDVADTRLYTQIGKVNNYRYPNVYELDFRLQKSFQIGPVTFLPTVELFNVANSNAVLQRYERTGTFNRDGEGEFNPDPRFNQIIEVQSPRIMRLGFQVNF